MSSIPHTVHNAEDEPHAAPLTSSGLIISALLAGQITARDAADLLEELEPVRKVPPPPRACASVTGLIAEVRQALIVSGQTAHAVVFVERAHAAPGTNALLQIMSDYAERG